MGVFKTDFLKRRYHWILLICLVLFIGITNYFWIKNHHTIPVIKSVAEKDKQIQNMQQEMQVIRMELLEVKMKQVQELQKIELEKRNIKKQR